MSKSKSKVRMLNGYRVIYDPTHPKAMTSENWNGYVYEHVAVAQNSLGRSLESDEVVHHLDGNRENNRSSNLLVLERSQHAKLHRWMETNGAFTLKDVNENGVNSGKPKSISTCKVCGKTLQAKQKGACSLKCKRILSRKVERPDRPTLEIDMQNLSMVAIGSKYGVSDNAIRKWIKSYEIDTAILSQASGTPEEGAETSGEVKSS
jgi:predicted nucleic acid-binding Zn ribbon protein